MPRQARVSTVIPGAPHHVILRGNNRRRLFSYPREYRYFLLKLEGASLKHRIATHAWCLMANHVHLVVTPPDATALGKFVQSFAQSYAQYRNGRRNACGKLFESRYIAIPIRSESQYMRTVAYAELNPVRAGLRHHPADYQWSSYRLHAANSAELKRWEQLWSPPDWYTRLGENSEQRTTKYIELVDCFLAEDDWKAVQSEPGRAAGSRRFERPNRSSAV